MQRDMKVGMALGVALVGIVGALFFRREPEKKDPPPPPLQGAEELDKQIAEKARGPYIKGVEDFVDSPAPVPPPHVDSPRMKRKPDAYEVPGFLTKEDEEEHRIVNSAKPAAPDPIQSPSFAKDHKPANPAAPAHNRDWEPGSSSTKNSQTGNQPHVAASPAAQRTHVIQSGDTLSGIAAKYLGSSARYREIYDANRNVLRSPDDLPDGATIVIPDGGRPRDPAPVAGTSNATKARKASTSRLVDDSEDVPAERPVPAAKANEKPVIKFAPAKRGPFSSGRSPAAGGNTLGESAKESAPRKPRIEIDDDDAASILSKEPN